MTGRCLSEQSEKTQMFLQSQAFVLSIFVCAAFSVYYAFPYTVVANNDTKIVPENTINPNTDTAVSMARLPLFGQTKAGAVVEYRQTGNVFRIADDLDKVKGIGPKTVETMRPYLRFE
ncbi:MAG: helix-hairpin-helix domain-containing protein [Sedimentisphaerales bacterium]|nr:helix-hairpin-helix domain-containing protein [Sedimentisphaerales bacterium]